MLIGAHIAFRIGGLATGSMKSFQLALRFHGKTPAIHRLIPNVAIGSDFARTSSGALVLFSGHIQNRAELRKALVGELVSDAALYAAGYSRWGEDVDFRVVGQYSSIIIENNAPKLRLCASPITCTPLHYSHDGKQFIVASRAQAIFDTGRLDRELDEQKVADSLFLNYQDSEQGWFRHVNRLAAGSRAFVTPEGVWIDEYYRLEDLPSVKLPTDEDYVEAADSLFREGTAAMLEGFVKPAVSLSGGYDSQAVAAYIMGLRPEKPLLSFTGIPEKGWDGIVRDGNIGDERSYVEALSKMYPQLDTNWIEAAGRGVDYFQREMFEFALQNPRNSMNFHWIHDVYSQAKLKNCDVLFTGAMGNGTFSYTGNHALSGWLATGNIAALLRELLSVGPLRSIPKRFFSQSLMPLLPNNWRDKVVQMRGGSIEDVFNGWCPMNRDYAAEMNVAARAKAVGFDPLFRPQVHSRQFRARLMKMFGGELADTSLALDAIHGMSSRDPTSYRPLVEFCWGIPDDQYLRGGKRRFLARRMLADKLPQLVVEETRTGFQAADWHLRLSRQRDALIEEIDVLKDDPKMLHRLDLNDLQNALKSYPKETPRDQKAMDRLLLATTRGISMARFIRFLEGRNS